MVHLHEFVKTLFTRMLVITIAVCSASCLLFLGSNACAYTIANWSGEGGDQTCLTRAQSYDSNYPDWVYYSDAKDFSFTVVPDQPTTDPTEPVTLALNGRWYYKKMPSGPAGPSWNKIEMWIGIDEPALSGSRLISVMDYLNSEASRTFSIPISITPNQIVNGRLFVDTHRSYETGYNTSSIRLESVDITTEEVPEPATILLLLFGLGTAGLARFRRKLV